MKWEYLYLEIDPHNEDWSSAGNVLVSSSDGRWKQEKMRKDPARIFNQLGSEGWEMLNFDFPGAIFAVLKRPSP
jgi:hypothetical protein